MKIIIINRMLGVKIGGGENFDINIAKQLMLNNYDVTIIAGGKKGRIPSQLNYFNDKLLLLKTPYLRHLHYFFKGNNFIFSKVSAFFLELDLFIFEYKVLKHLKNDSETNVFQICDNDVNHPFFHLKFRLGGLFTLSLPHGDFQTARQLFGNYPFGGPLSCTSILTHWL